MKKIICILLTLLLTLAFIACGNEKTTDESKHSSDISSDLSENTASNGHWETPDNASLVVYSSYYTEYLMTFSEDDTNTLFGYLNSITDWNDSICKCLGDFILEVTVDGKTTKYSYSADDGHLNDHTNIRSYEFDESARKKITDILYRAAPIGEEYQPNEESKPVSENENSNEASNETSNDDTVSNNSPLVVYPSYNSKIILTLSAKDANTILGYFNSITDWMDGTCDCLGDYSFEVTENGKTTHYNYSLDDGHLNDSTNQRSYNFSESAREEINKILVLAYPIGEMYEPNEDNGLYTLEVTHGKISYVSSVTPPGFARTLESDAEYIVNLLENGEWINDLAECVTNVWVNVEGKYYEYCSACGCFLDIENCRTLNIKDGSSDHKRLNSIFTCYDGVMELTVHPAYNEGVDIKLSEKDYDEILTLILCASWREGTYDCIADYIFEINEGGWITKYGYHTSCGTLNNYTDRLSYKLSESAREEINKILEQTPKDLCE